LNLNSALKPLQISEILNEKNRKAKRIALYRFGGMFLLPISEHCPVKLHSLSRFIGKSLFDAETLKPALSRQ